MLGPCRKRVADRFQVLFPAWERASSVRDALRQKARLSSRKTDDDVSKPLLPVSC